MQFPRPAKPTGLVVILTLLLLVLLVAAYVGAMYATIDVSHVASDAEADDRDAAYAYLHVVMLLGAAVIGFLAGKWFNGLGVAFGTLFVLVMAVGMLAVQLTSYELACQGHNDIVRHWQC